MTLSLSTVAVIPTLMLAGPAALLAALFPGMLAALALFWRRWAVLLAISSLDSTLYLAHSWFRSHAQGSWWGHSETLWIGLVIISGAGVLLSLRRMRTWLRSGRGALLSPGRADGVALGVASVVAAGLAIWWLGVGAPLRSPWREGLPIVLPIWAGCLYLLGARRLHRNQPLVGIGTEACMLAALAAGCALAGTGSTPSPNVRIVWTFEALERGQIISTPLLAGDKVYVSAAHGNGLTLFGAVYCLDRTTGKLLWTFNNGGRMKQAFSSPTLAGHRLYVGEGLHEDSDCRLYCLDPATGKELWSFVTKSHTESSPRAAGGYVYVGAGDDGVYCLDAAGGEVRWHFPGLHVDTTPTIVGTRLYAGSAFANPEMFCLDAVTGQPLWRTPSDFSVFGSAAVAEGRVYFGVGNGKLTRSDSKPAGALICLDAQTGKALWRHGVADAVLSTPTIANEMITFTSRDHHCYALDRMQGQLRWRHDLGSPVVAAPVLFGHHLYAVATEGTVVSLDPTSGAQLWHFDVGNYSRTTPQLLSSPALSTDSLYLGAGLHYGINTAAVVYCLREIGNEQ